LRPVQLLRRDSACRASEEPRPAHQRRADAQSHQGVAGDAGGGGRRRGRQAPHEPGAQRAERNPARGADKPAGQQPLHAALDTGLEGAGPCPALRFGNRELCRRPVRARQGPGGTDAGGGRAARGGSEARGQRTQDPMPAVPGGSVRVPRIPYRTQLSTARARRLYRHPAQQGGRPGHLPQDQRDDGAAVEPAAAGGERGAPEPGHDRMGELLQPRAGQPGLQRDRPPRGPAASPVALSQAQGEDREIRALRRRSSNGLPAVAV